MLARRAPPSQARVPSRPAVSRPVQATAPSKPSTQLFSRRNVIAGLFANHMRIPTAARRRGGNYMDDEEEGGGGEEAAAGPAANIPPHLAGLGGGFIFDTKGRGSAGETSPNTFALEEQILAKQQAELKKMRAAEGGRRQKEARPRSLLEEVNQLHYDETLDWRSHKFNPDKVGYIDEEAVDWTHGETIQRVRRDPAAFSDLFHRLITRALTGKRYSDAFQLFLDMFDENVPRNPETIELLLKAIETPAAQGDSTIPLIIRRLAESNIPRTKRMYHLAITGAYNAQNYEDVLPLWDRVMEEKITPSAISVAYVMRVALMYEDLPAAEKALSYLQKIHMLPTSEILDPLAMFYYQVKNSEKFEYIVGLFNKLKIRPGFGALTAIAESAALAGNLSRALQAKNAIYKLGARKNPLMRTYQILLSTLLQNHRIASAEETLRELKTIGVTPNQAIMRIFVLYFCDRCIVQKFFHYWAEYRFYGYEPDAEMYDAFLDACHQAHVRGAFLKAFTEMMEKNIKPQQRHWTRRLLLIAEYAIYIDEVLKPFEAIRRTGFTHTREDFAILLTTYAKFNDHEGMLTLLEKEMRPAGHDFDLFEWNLLLRVYVNISQWEPLIKTFENMLAYSVPLDASSFTSAIRAAREMSSLFHMQKYLTALESRIEKVKLDNMALSLIIRYFGDMDDIYSAEHAWNLATNHHPKEIGSDAYAEIIAVSSAHRSWNDVYQYYSELVAKKLPVDNKIYAFVFKAFATSASDSLSAAVKVARDYVSDTKGVKYISRTVLSFFLLKLLRHGSDEVFDEAIAALEEINKAVFNDERYSALEHDQVLIESIPNLAKWIKDLSDKRVVPSTPIERDIDFLSNEKQRRINVENAHISANL